MLFINITRWDYDEAMNLRWDGKIFEMITNFNYKAIDEGIFTPKFLNIFILGMTVILYFTMKINEVKRTQKRSIFY